MDTGNGAAFIFRNDKKAFMIPLPVLGHWMKKAGALFKADKTWQIPKIAWIVGRLSQY